MKFLVNALFMIMMRKNKIPSLIGIFMYTYVYDLKQNTKSKEIYRRYSEFIVCKVKKTQHSARTSSSAGLCQAVCKVSPINFRT